MPCGSIQNVLPSYSNHNDSRSLVAYSLQFQHIEYDAIKMSRPTEYFLPKN